MKRGKSIAVASVLILVVTLSIGGVLVHVRQFPTFDVVLPVVSSFLETNGYSLVVKERHDVTRTRPPLFLRLRGIIKEFRERGNRLGGVAAPYQHGYTCEFRSEQGKEITVAMDIRGSRVYQVTFISGTNSSSLFTGFITSLKEFSFPVENEVHEPTNARDETWLSN